MKNSPLMTILMAALLLSALASLLLCWFYIGNTRELRSLQGMVNNINVNRQISSALAVDAVEYGKTHTAITPILKSTIPNYDAIAGSTNGNKPGAK